MRQRTVVTSVLRIRRPTVHDAGYYRCNASNVAGSKSAETIVKMTNRNGAFLLFFCFDPFSTRLETFCRIM